MICRKILVLGSFCRTLLVPAIIVIVLACNAICRGQGGTGTGTGGTNININAGGAGTGTYPVQTVGGVAIDAQGVLGNVERDTLGVLAKMRAEAMQKVPADLNAFSEMRKVSLRRLEDAIIEAQKSGKQLPDDIRYLAGLQQIRYVFVYPEQKDIVLAGPGEGWKVDARGNVVGITTGRPVMLLDDLLVALRSAQAAQGGISCSIDPTPEGVAKVNQNVKALQQKDAGNPRAFSSEIEQLLGMQQISIVGVPGTSHFAQVLVAADYRMKRLGMNFDAPPPGIKLPSYLQMIPANTRNASIFPRWWLEPNYQPLLRDPDGLAWELRGASVKTLTEDAYFSQNGVKQQTGKANPAAQKWAENMTNQFAALAVAEPIFGELRNCMELAIVSALIVKERLTEKTGYSMPVLLSADQLPAAEFNVPKQVASQASVVKKGNGWIISASGGVMINSWGIADKTQQSGTVAPVRAKAAPAEHTAWWWN